MTTVMEALLTQYLMDIVEDNNVPIEWTTPIIIHFGGKLKHEFICMTPQQMNSKTADEKFSIESFRRILRDYVLITKT